MTGKLARIPIALRIGGLVAVALVVAALLLVGGKGDSGASSELEPVKASQGPGWMPSGPATRSVIWAVGDAADGSPESQKVASMIRSNQPDRLLYLGDVYDTGTDLEFDRNYRPIYGGLDSITAPTIGNHEWPNVATGYVPYWTAARRTPPPFWYAFTISGWQLISLNSNVPSSSDQLEWLRDQLATTPGYGTCRIAFMHHPMFSAGPHGDLSLLQPVFGELRSHASIVLSGHDHDMQRLHPIDGITPYVDGAGGAELYPVNRDDPRLAFYDDTHHGALRIKLRPGSAVLSFVDQDGRTLDRSAVSCRQA